MKSPLSGQYGGEELSELLADRRACPNLVMDIIFGDARNELCEVIGGDALNGRYNQATILNRKLNRLTSLDG